MSPSFSMLQSISENQIKVIMNFDDPSVIGKSAKLELRARSNVHDSRAVNDSKVLYSSEFAIDGPRVMQTFPLEQVDCYTYKGKKLDIEIYLKCTIDDGIFFDSNLDQKIILHHLKRPEVNDDVQGIINPKDLFNFFENLQALPVQNKIATIGLVVAGAIVIGINTLIGYHDQSVSPSEVWLYSQRDSDGDAQSPLMNSLLTSGPIGLGIWYAMKRQLRKYMTFFWKKEDFSGEKGTKYEIAEYLGGVSRVDLHNVSLRIVAANIEKGQYQRGSGTKTRTVSFTQPIRGIVLYSKFYEFIPKHTNIDTIISGSFSFDEMYKALYPECEISSTHGLSTVWEAQLIHDTFIDQELYGTKKFFRFENFLDK